MTSVDSHMHANFNGLSVRNIIKYLDKERIDLCWLLSWEEIEPGPWAYQHLSVEYICEAYLKYPQHFIPFYAPDPHRPDASLSLEKWSKKGIRGCGELKATMNWDSEPVKSVLQTARNLKMPVVFHMEESDFREMPYSNALFDKVLFACLRTNRANLRVPKSILTILVNRYTPIQKRTKSTYAFPGYMLDFASLENTLRAYPDINFVAHGPMFWKYISDDAVNCHETYPVDPIKGKGIIWRLLRDYSNLYTDISGMSGLNALTRDSTVAKQFLWMFQEKILYGTDNVMQGQKEFLNSLRLPRTTYRKIYGENACRIIDHVF
jgi:predicted TIM-barrel fold metal-dependent hydrolase